MRRPCLLLVTLLFLLTSPGLLRGQAPASPSATAPHVSVTLIVPPQQLAAGASYTLGLEFKLERGWHVYWQNAGDSGEPPRVTWALPAGITADAFLYPTPKRLPLGPLMDYGYEDQVVFPVPLHVAASAQPGPTTLGAKLDWLVCREVCLPGKAALGVSRPVVAAGASVGTDASAAALVASAMHSLPQPLPGNAIFAKSGKSVTLAVLTGHPEPAAQFFPADQGLFANAAPQPAQPLAKGIALTLAADPAGSLPGSLAGIVVFPDRRAYSVHANPGTIPASAIARTTGVASLVRVLGLAFLGGIILNLMPCVFPVLFIKGLSLLRSSQHERGQQRAHGWVYALGIVVSFWAVVGLLLALRTAGHQLGWGFQFQSPTFIAIMALFLFFLALSLAGQFEIGLSLTSAGGELANKGGYAGSFFTGVLAMVVATPCTAPFMGAAIGYALAASAAVSFAVFTALALGLAAPYLLLAYNPGWTRLLPRPGAWMEVLKQAIAVPIFATVIWLVWLFTQSAGVNALLGLLAGFLLLGVAGWILGRWPAKLPATLAATAVLAVAVALPVVAANAFAAPAPGSSTNAGASGNDWVAYTTDAVEKARAQGKPVLVDFTASWCLSCQVNERVVLDRADVQQRLRESGVVLVRADWTRHDETIGAALAALGRSGIPAYALYPAAVGAAPQLLPEVLTPGIVFGALDGLKQEAAKGL